MTEINVTWKEYTLTKLVPDSVRDVVDEIAATVEGLTAIIDIVADALDIALTVVAGVIDLLQALLLAAVEAIEAAIEFLVGTSMSFAYYVPKSYRNAPTAAEMLDKIGASMVDRTDSNRPIGTSDNPFVMLCIMGVGPNISKLQELFKTLLTLFNLPLEAEIPDVNKFFDPEYDQYPPKTSPGEGEAPDWTTRRLADVGFLGDVVSGLIFIRDALRPAVAGAELAKSMINQIRRRMRAVEDTLKKIAEALGSVAAFTVAKAGLHTLSLVGEAPVAVQAQAVRAAAGDAGFPFAESDNYDAACATVCIHAQFGSGGAMRVFADFIGVYDRVEAVGVVGALAEREDFQRVTELKEEIRETARGERRPGLPAADGIRRRWTPPEE